MNLGQGVAKVKKRIKRQGELDGVYLILLCILCCAGLLMLISASTPDSVSAASPYAGIIKNCIVTIGGFAIMLAIANIGDYKFYAKYAKYAYWISILLMAITPIVGTEALGAKRWIYIGPISFQPSELMKVTMIIYLADVLAHERPRNVKNMSTFGKIIYEFRHELIVLLPAGLAAMQKHLSGALIIAAIGGVILLAHGMKKSHILGAATLGVTAVVGLIIAEPFRMRRIMGYTNPEADPLGDGWQILQSLYAICSGGLFGVGFGQSRQKYNWLPMASNDYIFAIICEEMGMIGGIAVLLLFAMFVWRGVKIAINARDMFGTLIAFGVSAMIGLQVVINIAVVTNLIPSTGMQLPFFSSGGTSLLIMLAATGLVLNISKFQRQGASKIEEVK